MKFLDDITPKRIVAVEGKYVRSKNDVYVPKHYDEQGNIVEEHIPYYTDTVYVPDSFTEEQMNEIYVEEEIK
jgi:nanoRNase/pAp phosphatase (c-di-AMP/oligoRNAs hydrolase)